MPESTLPDQIKLVKFCKKNARLDGFWPLQKFTRLTENALDSTGKVSVQAVFSVQHGFPTLCGKVQFEVRMQCQRCLEPVCIPLNAEINLGFVQSESELENLPDFLEGVIYEPEEISLIEVVEQELLLALPLIPYHEDCDAFPYQDQQAIADQPVTANKDNPFQVLQSLRTDSADGNDQDTSEEFN